jgi:hypothetical protein
MQYLIVIMILFLIGSILIFFGSYTEINREKKIYENKRKLKKEIEDKINKVGDRNGNKGGDR